MRSNHNSVHKSFQARNADSAGRSMIRPLLCTCGDVPLCTGLRKTLVGSLDNQRMGIAMAMKYF
jgi:hypothetical protein